MDELLLRVSTKVPDQVKKIVARSLPQSDVSEIHNMLGADAVIQISIAVIGTVGSLASIVSIIRDLRNENAVQLNEIYILNDKKLIRTIRLEGKTLSEREILALITNDSHTNLP